MATIRGLMFNLLERYLLERDEALLERVLQRAGQAQAEPWVDGCEYPQADFQALLAVAAGELGIDPQALLRAAADWSVPLLLRRFESLVAGLAAPMDLLEALGETVHPQLCRMLRGSCQAQYSYERTDTQICRISYRSERRLCAAVEGALAGLARHFGAPLQIHHQCCQQRGDLRCELSLQFNGVTP